MPSAHPLPMRSDVPWKACVPRAVVGVFVMLALSPMFSGRLAAQERDSAAPTEQSDATVPATPDAAHEPENAPPYDERERQYAFQVGVMMIGGILIAGVGLMAVVLIWGRRYRRIARQPLPEVSARDELWYLKNKKPGTAAPSSSDPSDQSAPEGPEGPR